MDPDILILFDEHFELVLKFPLPSEMIGTKLGLMEFKYVYDVIAYLWFASNIFIFILCFILHFVHRFLLEDLTQKVESIFGVRKFGQTMESFQTISQPAVFISDITNVLPKILEHFNQVAGELNKIIGKDKCLDTEDDSEPDEITEDLFSDEANLLKVCFGLCIRLMAALFSWPEFTDDVNKDTLIR